MKLFLRLSAVVCLLTLFGGCNIRSKTGSQVVTTEELQPTPETQDLLSNLRTIARKGFLFGHQDATLYGVTWEGDSGRSDVHSVVGDYPAVIGFDIGRLERGSKKNIDNVSFETIRKEIIRQYERGGVITISWHADNPLTGGDSWDVDMPGGVSSILPGGDKHELFLSWLQKVVDFFHSLKTDDGTPVPILFRPWHEHTGSWFWWGKDHCSAEEYKQLWYIMRNYFDKEKVNNVLYVYSPDAQGPGEVYMERYPGDEFVDMLGLDCYHRDNEDGIEAYTHTLHTILSFMTQEGVKRNKPIALTETGLETIPISNWWTGVLFPVIDNYPVSYVLVWRNARERDNHYYAPFPGHLSVEDFIRFYQHPKTLFSRDLQDIYNYKK